MCSIAERTIAGQDFGKLMFEVGLDMLAPGRIEPSITEAQAVCYGRFACLENSVDHYTEDHKVRIGISRLSNGHTRRLGHADAASVLQHCSMVASLSVRC